MELREISCQSSQEILILFQSVIPVELAHRNNGRFKNDFSFQKFQIVFTCGDYSSVSNLQQYYRNAEPR